MVVQPCTLRNRFVSIDSTFLLFSTFDSLSLSLSRTHTHAHTVHRNIRPEWLEIHFLLRDYGFEISILPSVRRYCRIAAILPIHSFHYSSNTNGKLEKMSPDRSIYFPPLWCGFSERLLRIDRTKIFSLWIRSSFLLYYVIIIFRFIRDVDLVEMLVGTRWYSFWKFGKWKR